MHEIIFLNRAYNDLDTQLPLIDAFASDRNFSIRVIGYPSDGDMGSPQEHEAAPYMKSRGVKFETVLESSDAPFILRFLYKTERALAKSRKYLPIVKFLHVAFRMQLKKSLQKDQSWLVGITKTWLPKIVIVDDVYAQPGRADMIDKILPEFKKRNAKIYAILTGHRIYTHPNPAGAASPKYRPGTAEKFFVPNDLNQNIYKKFFKDEPIETAGNLRMDKKWIEKLHKEILCAPYYKTYAPLPNKGKIKIALMLSKLNYGVEKEQLQKTIKNLGLMEDIDFTIKPHTRGMKFDFMKRHETGHAVLVPNIPSASLIEWADLVLFTGSSIVFHAMLRGKTVGFLKYCQNLQTIFDDGSACTVFNNLNELLTFVKNFKKPEFLQMREWLKHEIHNELENGAVAEHYRQLILKDAGLA